MGGILIYRTKGERAKERERERERERQVAPVGIGG